MNRLLSFVAFLSLLLFGISACAQQTCSYQTIAGTYVMQERGSSLMLNPTSPPEIMPFFTGASAPFVNIAEITFGEQGTGDGIFWLWNGQIRPIVDPISVHLTITELNDDCTGKLTYVANLPIGRSVTIEERFVVFDEGRELRTVPSSVQNGTPLVAWVGTGHRIKRGAEPPRSCGPQTSRGRYLMTCENIVVRAAVSPNAIADTFLLVSDVGLSGDYTGTIYERIGEKSPQLAVSGVMHVNADCSFSGTLDLPSPPFKGSIITKGVFFDEGKHYYAMAILNNSSSYEQQGIRFSACEGTRIGE